MRSPLANMDDDLRLGEIWFGRVQEVVSPTLVKASLSNIGLGDLCWLCKSQIMAEVIRIVGHTAWLALFSERKTVKTSERVMPLKRHHRIGVSPQLLGRVVDGLGEVLDATEPIDTDTWLPLECERLHVLKRGRVDTVLETGIKAIDALLSIGYGQRMGIFAGAGVGKTTLISMLCNEINMDVIVIALIGERSREVHEFLTTVLNDKTRQQSVVVAATADRPALERYKALYTATTIAEYFRDRGHRVMLLVDSLTRFARAADEIAVATGEPSSMTGFPASLMVKLPALLERVGPLSCGSITGIYTVLLQQEKQRDIFAEEIKAMLDGHILLSRKQAETGLYPAIDVSESVSRLMPHIVTNEHYMHALQIRRFLTINEEIAFLLRVGEYQAGQDREADEALARRDAIRQFLCQTPYQKVAWDQMFYQLSYILSLC